MTTAAPSRRSPARSALPTARHAGVRPVPAPTSPTVLRIDVDTEIDATVISLGDALSGTVGAAGQLGHIVVPERTDAVCWCGNRGCLTAVAGATALARHVGLAPGIEPVAGLLALERAGDTTACTALRTAGWQLATVLRHCVAILDPHEIVVAGGLGLGSRNLRWGVAELYEAGHPVPRCPVRYPEPDDERLPARRPHLDRRVAVAG